jgi:hypothetical protein
MLTPKINNEDKRFLILLSSKHKNMNKIYLSVSLIGFSISSNGQLIFSGNSIEQHYFSYLRNGI